MIHLAFLAPQSTMISRSSLVRARALSTINGKKNALMLKDTALHLAVRARLVVVVEKLLRVTPWSALNDMCETAVGEAFATEDEVAELMREEYHKAIRAGAKANPDHYWACIRVNK